MNEIKETVIIENFQKVKDVVFESTQGYAYAR